MAKQIKYNLPGCGLLFANIYSHTEALNEFLGDYGHIERLQRLDQLGRLRDVFPGAHHTRYEYVFLQWALISELSNVKDSKLGLNTEKQIVGKLPNQAKYPTVAEILQCLVLLLNIGYLEGTFAASRAWIQLLQTNKSTYRSFKNGLDELDKPLFIQIVEQGDFYRFHIVLTMFLLKRYTSKENGKEYVNFSLKILRLYLSEDLKDSSLIRLKELFKNIRRIAFLSLDAFYAPVPFSLDLSSIIMSFKEIYRDVLVQSQGFQTALKELEVVLQNTVYLSDSAILKTSQATEDLYQDLLLNDAITTATITGIKDCLIPNKNNNNKFKYDKSHLDWNEKKQLLIIFDNCLTHSPNTIKNQVSWEENTTNTVGKTRCRFGLLHSPNQDSIRLCFAIKDSNYIDELRTAIKGVNKCVIYSSTFSSEAEYNKKNNYRSQNANNIFEFLLRATLGWENRFILTSAVQKSSSFIGEKGKINFLKRINIILKAPDEILDNDKRVEISSLGKLVEIINYSGYMIGFCGATKLFKATGSTEVAEFDGVLFKTKVDPSEPFMYILESKNKTGGATESKRQLTKRLKAIIPNELTYEIKDIDTISIYAEIKLKPISMIV